MAIVMAGCLVRKTRPVEVLIPGMRPIRAKATVEVTTDYYDRYGGGLLECSVEITGRISCARNMRVRALAFQSRPVLRWGDGTENDTLIIKHGNIDGPLELRGKISHPAPWIDRAVEAAKKQIGIV